MPIKRLSRKDKDEIGDIIDDYADDQGFYFDRTIDDLNHVFAKIYGYKERRKRRGERERRSKPKTKRKLSPWNKFVKANSKKKIYQYANGKLKLKKMGIAYRKKRR